jgi:hypothetical protein
MNNELERIRKEAAVAQFKAISQQLLEVLRKTTKNLSQDF